MRKKKEKSLLRILLNIPIAIIVDLVIIGAASLLDAAMLPAETGGLGHAFPIYTLLGFFLVVAVTGITVLLTLMQLIRFFKSKKQQ